MSRFSILIVLAVIFISCGGKDVSNQDLVNGRNGSKEVNNEPPSLDYPKKEARDVLDKWIDSTKVNLDLPQVDENRFHQSLLRFYTQRNFNPAWELGPAQELITLLNNLGNEGLNPDLFPIDDLQHLFDKVKNGADAESGAQLDLMLSGTYLKIADIIATGKVKPGEFNKSWHIRPDKPDELHIQLKQAINGEVDRSLDFFRPQYVQYQQLIEELSRYNKIIENGGWPEIPSGETLKPGDSSSRISTLKQRLYISGDFNKPPNELQNPNTYDDALTSSVKIFQLRHGLEQSGVVDDETLRSLNIPATMRQKQIKLNIDRIRWFASGDMPDTYVLVNIPEYRLRVFENEKQIKIMKVVVGEVVNTTPIFSDYIEYAIFSPYWNVPESIAEEEIWPTAKRNPDWLIRNHYEVLDGWSEDANVVPVSEIKWDSIDHYNYRVRQKPGPWNALGRVKYMFPNDFAIYLHDTPADQLFDKKHRAFSHGCIRIEDPVWFGDWLFPQYTAQDIQRKMTDGERDIVPTDQHIPVYILYLTSFVDEDGRLHFRKDLYELDKQLAQEFDRV
ncbi:MAG: L,D-transpeptidase family protein [Candidatus Cyclobacteriaceae bacterium M2_1C_046]